VKSGTYCFVRTFHILESASQITANLVAAQHAK